MVCRPILTRWLFVRLMCLTKESALSGYKYRAGNAASIVRAVVVVVVVVGVVV